MNSLFVNNKVLVPTWSLPEDDSGLAVYRNALPGYDVVGINCAAMSGSGGAIHCITMQIPSSKYLHIKHRYLTNTNDTINPYRVRTQIITSSSIIPESTFIKYRVNSDTQYNSVSLSAVNDTPGVYVGYIPVQSIGDTIYYYMTVMNSHNIIRNSPNSAPHHYYSFTVTPTPSVSEDILVNTISAFKIYPNPSNNKISFSLKISKPGKVKIELFNSLGQKVKTLTDENLDIGVHTIQWNFLDGTNQKLPRGTYFYRILTENEYRLGKILFIE